MNIEYNKLDYGLYMTNPDLLGSYVESKRFTAADYTKLNVQKVRLPDGKGNVIYMFGKTLHELLDLTKYIEFPPSYRKAFYPVWGTGNFMGRRYKFLLTNNDRKERDDMIKSQTSLSPYKPKTMPAKSNDNWVFFVDYIYHTIMNIMEIMPVSRLSTDFYPELLRLLEFMSPERSKFNDANSFNRILVLDCEGFGFDKPNSSLADNKVNPMFILYTAFLRHKDTSGIDIDVLIVSKNMFMKFNPAKMTKKDWPVFRNGLFRIMNVNLDDYTEQLEDREKSELGDSSNAIMVKNIVSNTVEPYLANTSKRTRQTVTDTVTRKVREKANYKVMIDDSIKKAVPEVDNFDPNPTTDFNTKPLDPRAVKLFKSVSGEYRSLVDSIEDDDEDSDESFISDYEDEVASEAQEVLTTDDEVKDEILTDIQDNIMPLDHTNSPVNSERDRKMREQQKKVVVGNETIEQILERDSTNVPIITEDKSKVMHTSNENMKTIRFANFDKTYINELYMKDIVAAFDCLKDKEYPFYVTSVEVHDTSDANNFKDTWTVKLVDEVNKKYTINVDLPKFQNDRFMWLNGSRFMILKQNFYNPLVKDTPDTVILTTNFNKITITRVATKSLRDIERIYALIKKTGDNQVFMTGDSSKGNMRYISTLEYDELSKRLFRFTSNKCNLYFSRDYIKDNLTQPDGVKPNEFYIGDENGNPVCINEQTGLDRQGRTIIQIIEANLPEEYKSIYASIKGPKFKMYVQCKLAGQEVPLITPLIVWNGLKRTLDEMDIKWMFDETVKRVPPDTASNKYIKFADGVLQYENKTYAELIMNGLAKMHPERFKFNDFETEEGYDDFIYAQWGSYNGINELNQFKQFLVDPITEQVCKDFMLPTTPSGLLIHAAKLLSDNAYVSKASDTSYRVRSIEIIPAILYGCLADQYKAYVKSGRSIPMTLNPHCVISKLMDSKSGAGKQVEAYSTLNPVIEVTRLNNISTKGYKGSNSDMAYKDEQKRSYDPTSIGKLAMSTDPNSNVGVNHQLTIEPTIANARGYREPVDDINQLKDVNLLSPAEMLTPGTVRTDDAIRTSIANKQSGHIVPTEDASPSLVSNGFDEAVQFQLSDDFVINAEEDGKVIEVNDELGFVIVQYKSGKTRAISTKPEIVKNSGAGFYLANQLTPTHTKVGETFKKDEPLAYHPKYFNYDKLNGLRFSIGPLAKVAFMSSYNTYEDAGICTEALAEKMRTSIVYMQEGKFKHNNNIISIVKIGDHVNIGDTLIKFDISSEDSELAKYLSKLNDENADLLEQESKNDIKANHAGKIIDIKVYTILSPDELSPSLGKIVKQYFNKGISKKKFLEKYDQSDSKTMKAGYLLTDSTAPLKSQYGSIKGIKGIDVLIEIYIEHEDEVGVGDKLALYGPNKQIVSEKIPKGWEPYSEFRPDEEISVITSPGTIARRMTPSVLSVSAATKCMIELKRKIKDIVKFK